MADVNENPWVESVTYGNSKRWSLAYKGVIGNGGVVEARMGKNHILQPNTPVNGGGKWNMYVNTMASLNMLPGATDPMDPNSYYASGLIDANLARFDSIKDSSSYSGYTRYAYNDNHGEMGPDKVNDHWSVNYQHFLNTSFGQHQIDIGVQVDKNTASEEPKDGYYYSPGRIAFDLSTPGAVLGYSGSDYSQWAGKYIVYDMRYATFGSIDPYGFSRFNTGTSQQEPRDPNMLLTAWNNGTGYLPPSIYIGGGGGNTTIWPAMQENIIRGGSKMGVLMNSYYINDLWTINSNHSIMAGVRFDNFKAREYVTNTDIHSYTIPLLRFEYKFDINGDQKRVINFGYNQFHALPAVYTYNAFRTLHAKLWLWTGEGNAAGPAGSLLGTPYLVDEKQIRDKSNYTMPWGSDRVQAAGINEIASDVKNLVSNELELGTRFNLDNGGTVRLTLVRRTWENNMGWVFNGFKDNPVAGGNPVLSRKMVNTDKYSDRSYNSVELEWDVPVSKKMNFGGSYTFARTLRKDAYVGTGTTSSDQDSVLDNGSGTAMQFWDEILSQYGDLYNYLGPQPLRLADREHRIASYLSYNLSYGAVKSNVTFRFTYTSGAPAHVSYSLYTGFPLIEGWITSKAGDRPSYSPAVDSSTTRLYGYSTDYVNVHKVNIDEWSTNLNYNLTVPLVGKLSWFMNVSVGNPFNHRGLTYNFSGPGGMTLRPYTIYSNSGSVYSRESNGSTEGHTGGPYRASKNFNTGGLYSPQNVQGQRSMSLSAGLRF